MKNTFIILGLCSIVLSACTSSNTKTTETAELITTHDSASYAIGYLIAAQNKTQNLDSLNLDVMNQAMVEFAQKGDSGMKMTVEECQAYYRKYSQKIVMAKFKGEGTEFLSNNKTKEGVVTTASGLQYKIIREGSGDVPSLSDQVVCHYKGTLIDGKVFDSSYERNEPAKFPVSGVIRGWTEALQLMPTGSKWELYIPQDLAYGPRGSQPKIPPYSTLIFEIELLEILPPGAVEQK